jgi:hypothetical protein
MNCCMTILGRRRQGKSTLALALAAARSRSVLIYDVNAQYRSIPATPLDEEIIQQELEREEGCLLVFRPDTVNLTDDWHRLAEILWGWEDFALILDEASEFQSPAWRDEWLDRYLRQAPDSVSLIMTTHRIVDFAKLSRALSSDLFLFQTRQEADLTLLASEFPGIRTDVVSSLPTYHVLHHWVDHGGIGRNNLWNRPEEWYVNISAAGSARSSGDSGRRGGGERSAA